MVESTTENCTFCNIIEGRAPRYKIYEDELSLAILEINPFSKGHCLVIPKRHVLWWHEISEKENASLFGVAKVVAKKMMKTSVLTSYVCTPVAEEYLILTSSWSLLTPEMFWTDS